MQSAKRYLKKIIKKQGIFCIFRPPFAGSPIGFGRFGLRRTSFMCSTTALRTTTTRPTLMGFARFLWPN